MEPVKLPMPITYVLRNGEVKITEVLLKDVSMEKIRGVMITPKTELVLDEYYGNYEMANKEASKWHGELLSLRDKYLLKNCGPRIAETCRILKENMGVAYHFHEVDVVKGYDKMSWCQDWEQEDLTRYIKKPYRHYGLSLETGKCELVADVMHQSIRIVIRH